MYNIHTWKVSYNRNGEIFPMGQILRFTANLEGRKIISKALDGSTYVQTIGNPTDVAEIQILVTMDEKYNVDTAEAYGDYVTVVYKQKSYSGYLEEAPDWEAVTPGEWYKTTLKLIIEEVGNV